ncbi:MAG: hypothetical protein JW969_00265 [Spirochaetales bacterium]|nr:hypothetical protein [Spirochaetales bacterium]
MKKVSFLVLMLLIAMSLFNCSQVMDFGADASESGDTKAEFPTVPQVYRVEADGKAYLLGSDGIWHLELSAVKAIDGGIWDRNSGRYWNSFYVNESGRIFEKVNLSKWVPVYGVYDGVDVATNGGQTYAVNAGGYVFKYISVGSTGWFTWIHQVPGEFLVKVDVDDQGNPWVVTKTGKVYFNRDNVWYKTNNEKLSAIDIGCGDGRVYISAHAQFVTGPRLYEYNPENGLFLNRGVEAHAIDVDKTGTVWTTWAYFMAGSLHYQKKGTLEWILDTSAGFQNVDLGA